MSTQPSPARIDLVDVTGKPGDVAHVAKEIRINGIPVFVGEYGLTFQYGAKELTTVTIELPTSDIHFIYDSPKSEA